MILGVVSDTHNHMANVEKIITIFNSRKVDLVVHTGDISQPKTLDKFSKLDCPLFGVFGNNDLEEKDLVETANSNGFKFQLPPFYFEYAGRKIAVLHDPLNLEEVIGNYKNLDLILHGHTHRYRYETIGGVVVFNPGECAGIMKGKNAIGIGNLKDLSFERIFF